MTDKQDLIAHAARLLREAAEELRQAHAYNNSEGWENETDAKAAYDEHLAQALEDWEAAVGAGGVQPLRKCLHHIEEPLEKVLERREAVIQILERDAHEAHQRAAHALGTRKVLWFQSTPAIADGRTDGRAVTLLLWDVSIHARHR